MFQSSQVFIDNIHKRFQFLRQFGFESKPPKTFRDETSICYTSSILMVVFCHSSYNDAYRCVIGKPDIDYPKNPVSLAELLKELESKPELPKDSAQAIQKTSEIMKNELKELLNGKLDLISKVWAKEESAERDLYSYQKEVALNCETIGNAEILEIPNTVEALGSNFLERFSEHDLSQKTTWVVITKLADFNCNSYELAKEIARQHK
ncbi:hypothetical protein [Pseudoalteromonas sp. MMG006]|uniref:hypothetical protein n=1 Tax=Pseudoalteromonas sp. MMG006 TaxID=2822683 RepID=UPI001B36F518|nr:hypothetical protein [Pseudoalteromonas sp. MMG006]